jgi:hypothetical protein
MWKSLFETISKVLDFVRFWREESTPEPSAPQEEINPATQREGTAAGAAAYEASKIAGPPKGH